MEIIIFLIFNTIIFITILATIYKAFKKDSFKIAKPSSHPILIIWTILGIFWTVSAFFDIYYKSTRDLLIATLWIQVCILNFLTSTKVKKA